MLTFEKFSHFVDYKRHLSFTFPVPYGCLYCICEVESGCRMPNPVCRYDVSSDSCGPFQIKENYWIDGGRQGSCKAGPFCIKWSQLGLFSLSPNRFTNYVLSQKIICINMIKDISGHDIICDS